MIYFFPYHLRFRDYYYTVHPLNMPHTYDETRGKDCQLYDYNIHGKPRLSVRSIQRQIWGARRPRLTFRHHASYIQDRRTATPQSMLFTYLVNKYNKLFFLDFLSPSQFIPPQNVVYFLMLPLLVHKIFTLYINGVLNCKCPAPEPKGQLSVSVFRVEQSTTVFCPLVAGGSFGGVRTAPAWSRHGVFATRVRKKGNCKRTSVSPHLHTPCC